MSCPKCKAKIGTMMQHFTTDSGPAFGTLCYMCGCWIQGYTKPSKWKKVKYSITK